MRGDEFLPLTDLSGYILQQRVFCRWINVQLQDTNKRVDNVVTDLCDGTVLVELVQALTGERLFGISQSPQTHQDAISNIQISLNALATDGVEFEGIDASKIEQGDILQVLRLLWIVVLRYQVSLWDENGIVESDPVNSAVAWIKTHVPEIDSSCLTSNWSDGKLMTLLVNAVAPGLCPGGQQTQPENGLMFLERAMDRAEAWLGVPQVILPAEVHSHEGLDVHSLLTYLSLFRHAELLKDGAPLCFPEKSFAVGSGISGENVVAQFMTSFDIDCRMSGLGDLIVKISVDNNKVPYKVNVNGGVVNISYIPPTPGFYTIEILLEHEPMPGFPRSFHVCPAKVSPAHLIKPAGPGLETGLMSGQATYFTLSYDATKITPGLLAVSVHDENGVEFKEHVITHRAGVSTVQYTPPCNSIFEINVLYQGAKVPGCPAFVTVIPDMQKVLITDLPSHFLPGITASFFIRNINEAGQGKLKIKVHPENRPAVPIQVKDVDAGVVEVFFTPLLSLPHKITVSLSGTKKEAIAVPCYPCTDNIMIVNLPEAFTVDKKVEFNVDCTKAGIGELFINILDPTMKSVDEAELVLASEEYFEVSYMPRQPGVHSLFMSYDSVPLAHMPIQHTVLGVPTRPASAATESSQLLPIKPGFPHSIKIELKDIKEAPSETLVLSIAKFDGTLIPYQLDKESDFSYLAKFTLPSVGEYAISALLKGEQLPGFPYKICAILDLEKIRIEQSGASIKINQPVTYTVCTHDAGLAEFEAFITDPEGQAVSDAIVKEVQFCQHNVTFTPTKPGKYNVAVKYGGEELPDMPLVLDVAEDILAQINVAGLTPSQFCSSNSTFALSSSAISWEHLQVDVLGPLNTAVHLQNSLTADTSTFFFDAMTPGKYVVNVIYNNLHIVGSPFTSYVVPNVKNALLHPGNTALVSVGEKMLFQVDCSSVGRGMFSASVFPPAGEAFVPLVSETRALVYDVCFRVQHEGQYGIELKHGDIFLPMSPYMFKPSKDKREIKVIGLTKNQKIRPGDELSFEIDTSQFGPGYPEVYFSDSEKNPIINYTMAQIEEKRFKARFKATKVETYTIVIKKENQSAPESPYTLTCAVNTTKVKLAGKGVTDAVLTAGDPTEFQINTSEAGKGGLRVDVLDPEYRPVSVEIVQKDDEATVNYTPSIPGKYTIYIRLCDTLIPPSPFQITVLPVVEKTSNIVVTNNSGEVLTTGRKISFTVDVTKFGAGSIDVLAEVVGREIELEPKVEYMDGIFDVSIPSPISGEYVVFIKYNRKDVPGSPFKVLAKANAPKITASGPGLQVNKVPSKKESNFDIHLNGEKPSNVVVNVIDPYGYYVDDVVSQASVDTVNVRYLPMKTGLYIVEILCDDEHISGSPFSVNIEEVYDSSHIKIAGNMTEKNIFQFQEEAVMVVDYSATEVGGIEVTIKETNDGTLFQPSITEVEPKQLCIGFPTFQAGNFEVSILCNNQHVPHSPFNYLVISKGSEKVVIDDNQDLNATVHETLRIPVNIKNAGIGKLSSKCHHVRSKTSCRLQTVPRSDGISDIIFQAPQPGEYLIHVFFNNDEVPNSPVMVIAKAPSEAENYKLDSACARGLNGEMRFTIRGMQTSRLVVRCLDPVGEPTPFDLKYAEDDKYTLEVIPDADGTYSLEVYYNGFLINGCPKSFDVALKKSVEYSSIVVPDLNNIELNVNQSITFPIKIFGVDQGDLCVTCCDPYGQELDLEVLKEVDSALITFRPLKSGIHKMNVSLDGSNVAGSPFTVYVSKPDGAKSCTVKQEGIINGVVKLKVIQKCEGTLQVSGTGPNDNEIPLKVSSISKEISCIDFTPTDLGLHTIEILVDGTFIRGSPIEIDVQTLDPIIGDIDIVENDSSECDSVASLQKAIVYLQLPEKLPQTYSIQCRDSNKNEVNVEKINTDQKSVTVRFQPVQKGQHVVSLHSESEDNAICSYTVFIQEITSQESATYAANSDFRARINTPDSVNKFDITAAGAIRKPVFIGLTDPTVFTLKEWKGTSIPLIRVVQVASNLVLPHTITENEDSTYSISCLPNQPGKHQITITCDAKPLPGTPLLFDALQMQEAKGVLLDGPGIKSPMVVMESTTFKVDARNSGPGIIEVTVCNAYGYLPVDIEDHGDYTYSIKYQPITIGDYTVEVLFNGENVPQSPTKVSVVSSLPKKKAEPKIKRRVKKKDEPIFANSVEMTEFLVIYQTKNPVKFKIWNTDAEEIVRYKARRHRDGTFSLICKPTKPGPHVIKMYEDGQLITSLPYKFYVSEGKGTCGVSISGPGVTDGIKSNKETYFVIDTNEAGPGTLEVAVMQGKSPVQVAVSSKSDYIFTCKYMPITAKPIRVSVLFDKKHVAASPWRITCNGESKETVNDIIEEENDVVSEHSAVSIPLYSKTTAFCKGAVRKKEGSAVETEGSSSSLPTLSFSLPIKVSMEDGQKYIKLLLPINDLPALSNPKVYHINSSTKIPAAIVFSRHGYVLKCCPTQYGKHKVNVFDRSAESVDPLVFFYFDFVDVIRPSTAKLYALRSIHPTDYFPIEADSVNPTEIELTCRRVTKSVKVNSMYVFIVPKYMLNNPANVTIANKTTNQYIYTKTVMRDDENPGILCYPTSAGDYQITLYPSSTESIEIKFEFTVTGGKEVFTRAKSNCKAEATTVRKTGKHPEKRAASSKVGCPSAKVPITTDTLVEVRHTTTGVQVPASIQIKPSGEYTVQCEPTEPGKYIVVMSVNGAPVTGSPMYFTIDDRTPRQAPGTRAKYDVSGEVRHCTQEIRFNPDAVFEENSRLPCSMPGSDINSIVSSADDSQKDAVIKPCSNVFRSLANKKTDFFSGVIDDDDSENSISENTPTHLLNPLSSAKSDHPVKIMLPYFPDRANISVFNEAAGNIINSEVRRREDGTLVLQCHVVEEGRHRVDVYVDGKLASCGPLYFDVSSWDSGTLGLPFTGPAEVDNEFFDNFTVNAVPANELEGGYNEYTVGYAFADFEQVPVSLSSFSEGEESSDGDDQDRQEIRIQSSLELDALAVVVINEDSGEYLRARLIERNGDYVVRCRPTVPGHYRVNVKDGNDDVEGSPFFFDVLPQQSSSSMVHHSGSAQNSPVQLEDISSDSNVKISSRRERYFLNPGGGALVR